MLNDKTVLHPGNTASLTGSLQEIMTATNPGMFDRREYYKEKGVYYELRATTLQITSGWERFTRLRYPPRKAALFQQ